MREGVLCWKMEVMIPQGDGVGVRECEWDLRQKLEVQAGAMLRY